MLAGMIKIQHFAPGVPGHLHMGRSFLPNPVRTITNEHALMTRRGFQTGLHRMPIQTR
jgi:hypothetical protein